MHGFDELNECMWTWIDTDLDEYNSNCSNMAAAGQNLMMDASRQTSKMGLWMDLYEAAASNTQKQIMDRSSPKYRCRLICKDGQAS